ncbi:MAG: hypothetical protein ACI8UX_000291 [Psychromonas sp.]
MKTQFFCSSLSDLYFSDYKSISYFACSTLFIVTNRRDFLVKSSTLFAGGIMLPSCMKSEFMVENTITDAAMADGRKVESAGVRLYTFRDAMVKDALGTLEKIAALGYQQIESARSDVGDYHGLNAAGMKKLVMI